MLEKIVKNKVVSALLLLLRLYLGIWFIHHVFSRGMLTPQAWVGMGSAMKFLGISFLPGVWGFLAVMTYLVGSLLLICGLYTRWAAGGIALVLLVAANMHMAVGHGLSVAKGALTFVAYFVILLMTGPGNYTLAKYVKFKK